MNTPPQISKQVSWGLVNYIPPQVYAIESEVENWTWGCVASSMACALYAKASEVAKTLTSNITSASPHPVGAPPENVYIHEEDSEDGDHVLITCYETTPLVPELSLKTQIVWMPLLLKNNRII